jgi:hypothetical protein
MQVEAVQRISQEIQDLYSTISKAHGDMATKFLQMAQVLNIDEIKLGTKQEYDDNNYFSQTYLKDIGSCKGMELDAYDIEEGIPEIVKYLNEIELPNSLDYIEAVVGKEDYITRNPETLEELEGYFEYSHDVIEVVQYLLKNGVKIDELEIVKDFLVELIQAPSQAIPSSWEY